MTRERKKVPAPAHGIAAANRRAKRERAMHYNDHIWRALNPLKQPPKIFHKSHFELVENTDRKKKKLEFEITTSREPPPGFEFIPTGHPELSQECKEQSRDREAMYFIVSDSKDSQKLDHHMNRLGYHFRHTIVEEARKVLQRRGHHEQAAYVHDPGKPEPIPNTQSEIDHEADAVLRDLFPRIPNTDRQEIVDHAFKKGGTFNGEFKVGMAKDITLARRVQLAALAHIRHTHTRYDALLKESDWANARKAVEKPCLDIIVKWRGDEETGRDQLDEILREVIEISDSENESDDESSGADTGRNHISGPRPTGISMSQSRLSRTPNHQLGLGTMTQGSIVDGPNALPRQRELTKAERRAEKKTAQKTHQRFKRYAAAAEALANNTHQSGRPESHSTSGFVATPLEVRSQGSAYPVNTHRTMPSTVTRETYPSRISHNHTEVQRMPVPQSTGFPQHGMGGISQAPSGSHVHGDMHPLIRTPDTQRPKAGPYSATHTHPPPPPLSPVRTGLQDMLLPSIEPRSPDGSRLLQNAPQRVHREPQQFTEVPRVISRTVAESVVHGSRPRSPENLVNDDELAAKRRRVVTYFPEDFGRGSDPIYARVTRQGQDENLRGPHQEYHANRYPMSSRAPEQVVYHDMSWTPPHEVRVVRPEDGPDRSRAYSVLAPGDGRSSSIFRAPERSVYPSTFGAPTRQEYPGDWVEAPLRSRANPIVIDRDANYEARRVVEVRGSPFHGNYRTASPRGSGVPGHNVQSDARTRDPPRVIYVNESNGHVGHEPSSRQHMVSHSLSGQLAYQEGKARPQYHNVTLQRHTQPVEQYTQHGMPYESVPINESRHFSQARHGPVFRETRAPLPEGSRIERISTPQQHTVRSNPDGLMQQAVQYQPRHEVLYREVRLDATEASGVRYERESQQPFPVRPAPSSYAEIRGPPRQQRLPDHRDVVYVESKPGSPGL